MEPRFPFSEKNFATREDIRLQPLRRNPPQMGEERPSSQFVDHCDAYPPPPRLRPDTPRQPR